MLVHFLLTKKGISAVLIMISVFVIIYFWIFPFANRALQYVLLYQKGFTPQAPTIVFQEKGFDLVGELGKTMHLENNIKLIFGTAADTNTLKTYAPKSVLIVPNQLYFRGQSKITKIGLENITFDSAPETVTPERMSHFLNKVYHVASNSNLIVSFGLILSLVLLLAFIAAGVGSMIDAFSYGALSFGHLFRISCFVMLLMSAGAVILKEDLHFSLWRWRIELVLLYFLINGLLVYLINRQVFKKKFILEKRRNLDD